MPKGSKGDAVYPNSNADAPNNPQPTYLMTSEHMGEMDEMIAPTMQSDSVMSGEGALAKAKIRTVY